MKAKIKKLWVEALRSGDYKQTQGQLRDENNKFCCLGVLCNLHAQTFPSVAKKNRYARLYEGKYGLPPDNVLKWAGLDLHSRVIIRGEEEYLYGHNDQGRTFKQIAKAIEEQL